MGRKKITTKVTDGKRNGGLTSPRSFGKLKAMFDKCSHENARLYHLCFTGADSVAAYQKAQEALCRKLKSFRIAYSYFACVEDDRMDVAEDEDPLDEWVAYGSEEVSSSHHGGKGLHWHTYMLVDSSVVDTKIILNDWVRSPKKNWLFKMMEKRGMQMYLNKPRDHRYLNSEGKRRPCIYLGRRSEKNADRWADALEWASYACKRRSKDHGLPVTYFASRASRGALKQSADSKPFLF